MKRIITLAALALFLLPLTAEAQGFMGFVKDALGVYQTITGAKGYDTTYMYKPPYSWKASTKTKVNGFDVVNAGNSQSAGYDSFKSSRSKVSLGIDLSYAGIGAGISMDPRKLLSGQETRDKSIGINFYANRFGIDALLNLTPSLAGQISQDGVISALPDNSVSQRNLLINGYYVFNHKKFSYPAAFTQSFVQKKSVGSWMAAAIYTRDGFTFNGLEGVPDGTSRKFSTFGIGGGYGYNFVTPHKWLIHLSSIPMVSTMNYDKPFSHYGVMLTQRFAVIKNLHNDRLFINLTAYGIGIAAFQSSSFSFAQALWDTRLIFGVRF